MSDNPARPAAGVVLASLSAIPLDAGVVVDRAVGDARWSVVLARWGGGVVAFENRCPHAGMPLDRPDGAVMLDPAGYLICAAHLASFRLADGAHAGGPGRAGRQGLTRVAVAIQGDDVVTA